ncbi:MAG TPA: APC family permease [Blastocatellia bacterium]|nr:APC family permease [Blastocatellia bacterium]
MTTERVPAEAAPRFIRAVGLLGLTAISLNGVIGSGIFGLPATVAKILGPASPAAYVVAALATALIVMCFAEAGSMFERTGGPYVYAREAFGSFVGFEVGWVFFLTRLTAAAAIATKFADYLGDLWLPLGSGVGRVAALTLLSAGLAWLNFVGVRAGAWAVNVLTIAKLLPLLLFVGVGLFFVDGSRVEILAIPPMHGLREASLALIFAFGGFENASVPSEEVKDPARSLPVALFTSIAVTTVIYMLIQIVALGTLPGLAGDKTPLASAGREFLGPAGAIAITVGAVLSTSGSNSALMLVGPRILYALGEGKQLPAVLARVHARYRTPHVAIAVFAIAAWLLSLWLTFDDLVAVSAISRLLFSATTCLAVPVLRRRMPLAVRAFKIPGGAAVPLLAAAISIWLLSGVNELQAIVGLSALVFGGVLYLCFRPRRSRVASEARRKKAER